MFRANVFLLTWSLDELKLTSLKKKLLLNNVVTIVFSVSCIKQKTIFSKKFSNFLRLLLPFRKIFVSNDGQITEVGKKYSRGD